MAPTQYVILSHSNSFFSIHAYFSDSDSKKRWGPEGPRVTVGTTITLGRSLQQVVREHNIDRPLEFAQVEVTNIAYLGSCTNLPTSLIRTYCYSSFPYEIKLIILNTRRRKYQKSKTLELERSSHISTISFIIN